MGLSVHSSKIFNNSVTHQCPGSGFWVSSLRFPWFSHHWNRMATASSYRVHSNTSYSYSSASKGRTEQASASMKTSSLPSPPATADFFLLPWLCHIFELIKIMGKGKTTQQTPPQETSFQCLNRIKDSVAKESGNGFWIDDK